jgi:hypothetical protein
MCALALFLPKHAPGNRHACPTRIRSLLGGWVGWVARRPLPLYGEARRGTPTGWQRLPRRIGAQAGMAPRGDPGAGHTPHHEGREDRQG